METLPASASPPPHPTRLRIGLITGELAGIGTSTGLGSLVASLAETLVESGWEATVLLVPENPAEPRALPSPAEAEARRRVPVVSLPEPAIRCFKWPRSSSRAYKTYLWLREHAADFDRIVFCDRGGLGYYALLAKHQGLAFERLPLGVLLHSPTLRRTLDNVELVEDYELLVADFLERESARFADGVAASNEALLQALEADGWAFPEGRRALPPPLPASLFSLRNAEAEPFVPEEIVFFGPMESRKRLRLFCDAIDRLPAPETGNLRITFLGPPGRNEGRSGREYAERRAARWPYGWKVLDTLGREAGLAYLRDGMRLAVVGSASRGLPLTAWECLCLGIPFFCVGVEGAIEALPATERGRMISADPNALAARLREALRLGVSIPQGPIDPSVAGKDWIGWLADLASRDVPEPKIKRSDLPKVSVCLVHHDRPTLLAQAVESLRAQNYPDFEVILVDDGSATAEAAAYLDKIGPEFAERGWRIIRQPNLYLGAARNRAAREARGEFLLFMDDDNLAEPNEISTFVRVALRTGAAILTAVQREFEGKEAFGGDGKSSYVFAPLGPSLSLGVFVNFFGDANAFVRREAFVALRGFREDRGLPCEDWEFFAAAVLAGFSLEMVPEPLFWYRRSTDGMLGSTSFVAGKLRALRPYLSALPSGFSGALLLAQGKFAQAEAFWLELKATGAQRDRVQNILNEKERELKETRDRVQNVKEARDRVQNILNEKERELKETRDELSRIHRSRIWRLGVRLRRWEQKLRQIRRTLFHS